MCTHEFGGSETTGRVSFGAGGGGAGEPGLRLPPSFSRAARYTTEYAIYCRAISDAVIGSPL